MGAPIAYSQHPDLQTAVNEIQAELSKAAPALVLFFSNSAHSPGRLAEAMDKAFPQAQTFGCTTAGELISGKMLTSSIVGMGLCKDVVQDFHIQVLENISSEIPDVGGAFEAFENHFRRYVIEMSRERFVGVVLIDGVSRMEEEIMDKIGDVSNLTFIGGAAGDDARFEKTHVFANGRAYSDAALLALLDTTHGFSVLKTQSFTISDKTLRATAVDERERKVLEFNNEPAAEAYAKAVGDSPERIEEYFMRNPVGLIVGNEPYVRSPQKRDGGGIVFYCNVLRGMDLKLLESGDIVEATRKDLETHVAAAGRVAGLINFHCILRTLELKSKGQTEAYGELFSHIPTVGFSTYGEEYIGHINQTSTMLLLKGGE